MWRKVGVSPAQLQSMPWWHRRLLEDGLTEELERQAEAADGGDDGSLGDVIDPFAF